MTNIYDVLEQTLSIQKIRCKSDTTKFLHAADFDLVDNDGQTYKFRHRASQRLLFMSYDGDIKDAYTFAPAEAFLIDGDDIIFDDV